MTYYLKYRPQKISELDLDSVRESLAKIASAKTMPHAFLFSGPKGAGKTSAARILAKIVNCTNLGKTGEPCNKCASCKSITDGSNIDIIELDAASHRGIDDVRALRDAVKLAPASAKKKIYIIDEAHMLTTEASNALLKTLEEPPSHVFFILATTNPEKLISTIRSRTTNILFTKASAKEIERSLIRVVKGENLKVGKGVLELIAASADGAFRDAVKLLEQLAAEKALSSLDKATPYMAKSRYTDADQFVQLLIDRDAGKLITQVEQIAATGVGMGIFVEGVLARLREGLHVQLGLPGEALEGFTQAELMTLLTLFLKAAGEIPASPVEALPVEIALVKWCGTANSGLSSPPAEDEEEKELADGDSVGGAQAQPQVAEQTASNVKPTGELTDETWAQILASIRPINSSTEALLRAARPIGVFGGTLKIGVFYRFHKERLEEQEHRRLLEDAASEVLGGTRLGIECELTPAPAKSTPVQPDVTITESVVTVSRSSLTGSQAEDALTDSADDSIIDIAKDVFGN